MQDREKSKTTGTDPALSEESVQETARSLSNFGEAMRGSAKKAENRVPLGTLRRTARLGALLGK